MSKTKILIVEDDHGLREALVDTLLLGGYQVTPVESAETAIVKLSEANFDLVVSDIQMQGMDGLSLLKNIKSKFPKVPVILMTAYANINDAIQAMRDGATDYLSKPFAPQVLLNLVGRYAPAQRVESTDPIVGDESSKNLLALARKVAKSDATVMVLGPSGSGKEVLSRYIHDQSKRSDCPFVAINCAAIPENMLEATLFGYEKGAFTGAVQACPGKFEQAQEGTILLDEITEMDLSLQAKLLRVLQEREVERLGGRKTISLNVRVVATSNRDLKEAVAQGQFREDLYYRLNVFPITWLPLSQRPGDIIPLANHLIARHSQQNNTAIPELTAGAAHKLMNHTWTGNVRELENVVQRALILAEEGRIDTADLLIEVLQPSVSAKQYAPVQTSQMPNEFDVEADNKLLGSELRFQEHQIILDALQQCHGKRKDVAEKLGISPRTLRYKLAKMRESGIELPC
ncbi:sigma-54-dependent transcriptional regulator [Agaribacter marinus]|uniref:Sigma-54-dependent Fis family transcriptional regulator n=1 Tax=Agaribacter marinus TaxID=1431249 RepID=A0AA37SYR3_9ALTE|nr:sigma-54 dependent transcriptional regulator [Agaribacter marinus]GLR70734.1 sigma-54-dependent Fis family transcriptional regulator [Agaribacter marinus]